MNPRCTAGYRKFDSLFHEREKDFLDRSPLDWENHLLSHGLGVLEDRRSADCVIWSDILLCWVACSKEFVERVLALGFFP